MIAIVGGVVQTVTGFGGGVTMMLVLPYLLGMVAAPTLSTTITLGLNIALAWKFRKYIDLRICLFPTIVFFVFSFTTIQFVQRIQSDYLYIAFGLFLIFLSLFFFFISRRIKFRPSWKTGAVCSALSGIFSGLFGIGGPLLAIYFLSATETKESYIGNMQGLLAASTTINTISRVYLGMYTLDMIPLTIIGILGINLGKIGGLKIINSINREMLHKIIYCFVALSGILILIQHVNF